MDIIDYQILLWNIAAGLQRDVAALRDDGGSLKRMLIKAHALADSSQSLVRFLRAAVEE